MERYEWVEVCFSPFVFHQWYGYIYATKSKLNGHEWVEVKDGNAKICANTRKGVIKMNVPKEEWKLI